MVYVNKSDLKAWKKSRLAKRRAFLNEYKMSRGCEICGYNEHPQALTFDHIDQCEKDSEYSSKNLTRWNKSRVLSEIQKCRVLCAICHAIDTYENKRHMFSRDKELDGIARLDEFF